MHRKASEQKGSFLKTGNNVTADYKAQHVFVDTFSVKRENEKEWESRGNGEFSARIAARASQKQQKAVPPRYKYKRKS